MLSHKLMVRFLRNSAGHVTDRSGGQRSMGMLKIIGAAAKTTDPSFERAPRLTPSLRTYEFLILWRRLSSSLRTSLQEPSLTTATLGIRIQR